ncbi:MAG: PQQ-binding-like beta-propeller repeat protein [Pirellulales bacterium]|nr:PQQ-binding-like beta-propeller repeat protein [Pirellulales bacterium]
MNAGYVSPEQSAKTPPVKEKLGPIARNLGNIVLFWMLFLVGAILITQYYVEDQTAIANLVLQAGTALIVLTICLYSLAQSSLGLWRFFPTLLTAAGLGVFFYFYQYAGNTGNMRLIFVRRGQLPPPAKVADLNPAQQAPVAEPPRSGNDFPQFLGPRRDQVLTGTRINPVWTANPPKLMWKHPVGQGLTGFAVVDWRAITMEQRELQECVICYHVRTGEILWVHQHPNEHYQFNVGWNGPRSTPTIHNGRVYAQGAAGKLVCLDLQTGDLQWEKEILNADPKNIPEWGKANSPLIVDNQLIVVGGLRTDDPEKFLRSLISLDPVTGNELWAVDGHFGSYASPAVATLGGVRQIIIVNQNWIDGHDLQTGALLWSYPWPGRTNADANTAQAFAVNEQQVFVSKEYGVGAALFNVHKTEDDKWRATLETVNDLAGWAKPVLKTKVNNVSRVGEHVYGFNNEVLECVELATGKSLWRKRGDFGSGQLLVVEDKLLIQTEDGQVVLAAANPQKYQEFGRFQAITGEPCWNPPAFAAPYVLIRNWQEAACYELPCESVDPADDKQVDPPAAVEQK